MPQGVVQLLAKRGFLILTLSFSLVLLGGVAMAAVGVFGGDDADEPVTALSDSEAAGTFDLDAVAEKPEKDTPAGDEQVDEPAPSQPSEEPPATDESADEASEKDEAVADEPDEAGSSPEKPETDEPTKDDAVDDDLEDEMPTDTTPPELAITSPVTGAHVDEEVITFKGEVEHGARVFWSKYEANVTASGAWAIALKLAPGKNVMVFLAKDAAGNKTEAAVTVYYDKPEPESETHEFSANQKWEIVDGETAMNRYWGTADPLTKVWISSEYGGTKVYAGEGGGWEADVVFDAPCNKWFGVVVESGEHRNVFEMKYACAEEQTVEFSANQQYGVCSEEVPYDVFWGTAQPGSTVWVESPYGGSEVSVNGEGHWEVVVEFPNAPVGEPFQVVVSSSAGGSKTFTFKATGSEGA